MYCGKCTQNLNSVCQTYRTVTNRQGTRQKNELKIQKLEEVQLERRIRRCCFQRGYYVISEVSYSRMHFNLKRRKFYTTDTENKKIIETYQIPEDEFCVLRLDERSNTVIYVLNECMNLLFHIPVIIRQFPASNTLAFKIT